jgi:CRP-like cAMP-binding protein
LEVPSPSVISSTGGSNPIVDIPSKTNNRLLDLLSPEAMARVRPFLVKVVHAQDDLLYEKSDTIQNVYFPTTCGASELNKLRDGSAIEVATVGNEGLVGHWVSMAEKSSLNHVIVQVPGDSLRMSAADLADLLAQSPELQDVLTRYSMAYSFQVHQSVACNGLHQLEQRCCRWLLMTRDRVDSNEFPLTHQYLGYMLGVRRSAVTDVLAPLQAEGLLKSERGIITLLEPAEVESRACECYKTVRAEYDRLLSPT